MSSNFKEYMLNEAAVDTISVEIQDYLYYLGTESRNVQRIRLIVEEILLNIIAYYGGMKISIGLGKQFGRHIVRLRYEGDPFNPVKNSENPLSDDIMRSLGLFPAWNCRGKVNTVSLVLADRPKRSLLFYIMLAAAAAAFFGALGNVIPEIVRLTVNDAVLEPVSNGFLGLLKTFAGMMIFLHYAATFWEWGISRLSDGWENRSSYVLSVSNLW